MWRRSDPGFGGDQVEGEADPEGGAEEFARGEVGEAAGGEKDAHYGTDGGYCEAGRESADHPLAVQGDFAAADMPEGFAEREEEEAPEQRGGRGLVDAADGGHGEAHDQRGNTDDGSADEEDSTGNAVPLRVVSAEGGVELEWPQDHEENARNDVDECEVWEADEDVVEPGELRGYRIGWRW